MPGDAHALIVQVLQDEPLTAAWLMDLADHDRRFAACTGAETRSTSVGSMGRTERRADFMAMLKFPNEEDRIVIVEVQTEWKDEKHFRLPGYMTRAFEDHRLPTELVLVCPDDRVALKYRKGIKLGPDNTIKVHAVGGSDFPGAEQLPTAGAAVITAVYGKHPEGPRAELFISTLDRRLGTIEPGRAADYIKHLLTILEDEPARMLEELMRTQARPYHSEYSDSLREEGALKASRRILVSMLEATQAGITAEQRQRIEASTDRDQLETWITKFISSGSAADLFD